MTDKKISKNPLALLGLLGFLGMLGLTTGNAGFYGFFGFFSFFFALAGKTDEFLMMNVARAGLNGFVISMVCIGASVVLMTITDSMEVIAGALAATLVFPLLTFVISFYIYDRGGK
ncbi:DUF3796 domain-containing protein [Methanosalsum natronophilum]|uniref:DUF3796 domain-containing protein n=1 Tax=Methanosalsum natronophilum TaxID=768733 RepID=UPI00216A5CD9|nr:DUF3796 domain-containing protein [Methanosalsum natronophilum]MCS3923606.1 hypothetical protein [Methanosalsum natronophilum]